MEARFNRKRPGLGTVIRPLAAVVVLGTTALGFSSAPASDSDGPDLELRLVSEVAAVEPGQPFTIGLHLVHGPGWHTYWKNPGIVGVPTEIEWRLPEGFRAGPIQWPVPEVVKMATLDAFGYEDEVTLLVKITPPKSLAGMEELVFQGKIIFMACASNCHPGFRDLELRLPVKGAKNAALDPEAIAESRSRLPQKPGSAWRFEVRRDGATHFLRIESDDEKLAAAEELFFFDATGVVDTNQPQTARRDEATGAWLIELPHAKWAPEKVKKLRGVLVGKGDEPFAIEVAARYRSLETSP